MADIQTTWFYCDTCDELHRTDTHESIPYHDRYDDVLYTCDIGKVWYCYDTDTYYHDDVQGYLFYNGNTELLTSTTDDLWHCDDCGVSHHTAFHEQYTHDAGSTCNSSDVVGCEECRDYFHASLVTMVTTARGDEVCPRCYESYYFTCQSCNEVINSDCYSSNGECDDCHSDGDNFNSPDDWCDNVYGYGTNVLNILSYGSKSAYGYLGIEYETIVKGSDRDDIDSAVNELLKVNRNHWIATSDSSLDGQDAAGAGVEFVTRPDSYENHVAHFTKVFENHHDDLGNTRGCGMHVHLSMEAFQDDSHIDKVAALLESFTDEQLHSIVGRKPTHYCARLEYKQNSGKYKDNQNGRYRLLNVRDETVEFRLCRTTRKLDRLKTRLQFILSVVRFCFIYESEAINLQQFFSYCENNAYHYPELWDTVKPMVETEYSDYWNVVFRGLNNYIQTTLELTYA